MEVQLKSKEVDGRLVYEAEPDAHADADADDAMIDWRIIEEEYKTRIEMAQVTGFGEYKLIN